MSTTPDRLLPDHENAYHYTVGMLFAQELEDNLKAILHTVDYSFEDLDGVLSEKEREAYKTFGRFLDKATAGTLKNKMTKAGIPWSKEACDLLDRAIRTRNELAHSYLRQLERPPSGPEEQCRIIHGLQQKAKLIFQALTLARATRAILEKRSNEQHQRLNELMRNLDIDPDRPNKGLWETRTGENAD